MQMKNANRQITSVATQRSLIFVYLYILIHSTQKTVINVISSSSLLLFLFLFLPKTKERTEYDNRSCRSGKTQSFMLFKRF